jgi:hypothetical protein
VFQRFGNDSEMVFDVSLERTPNVNGEDLVGKTIHMSYHLDVLGSPTQGDIVGPTYLIDVKEN